MLNNPDLCLRHFPILAGSLRPGGTLILHKMGDSAARDAYADARFTAEISTRMQVSRNTRRTMLSCLY